MKHSKVTSSEADENIRRVSVGSLVNQSMGTNYIESPQDSIFHDKMKQKKILMRGDTKEQKLSLAAKLNALDEAIDKSALVKIDSQPVLKRDGVEKHDSPVTKGQFGHFKSKQFKLKRFIEEQQDKDLQELSNLKHFGNTMNRLVGSASTSNF